jgi:hypothetical protein
MGIGGSVCAPHDKLNPYINGTQRPLSSMKT